jgi:hypothetical protein
MGKCTIQGTFAVFEGLWGIVEKCGKWWEKVGFVDGGIIDLWVICEDT